jgi:hypothetical protein
MMDQSGLEKKASIKWANKMHKAFDKMCLLMAANALAAYPDHNKRFGTYTDAFVYNTRRKAGCLLLSQADIVST